MNIASKHCAPCDSLTEPFNVAQTAEYLKQIPDWQLADDGKSISRRFKFKDFAESLAFVNKVGQIAETENHHPDIALGWGYTKISSMTHVIHGLSENDFILAAKINQI